MLLIHQVRDFLEDRAQGVHHDEEGEDRFYEAFADIELARLYFDGQFKVAEVFDKLFLAGYLQNKLYVRELSVLFLSFAV